MLADRHWAYGAGSGLRIDQKAGNWIEAYSVPATFIQIRKYLHNANLADNTWPTELLVDQWFLLGKNVYWMKKI